MVLPFDLTLRSVFIVVAVYLIFLSVSYLLLFFSDSLAPKLRNPSKYSYERFQWRIKRMEDREGEGQRGSRQDASSFIYLMHSQFTYLFLG